MTTYTYDNPGYADQTVVVDDSFESQCTSEYQLLDLQQEIKLLREANVSACRELVNAHSSATKIIRWNNEKISALKAEASVASKENIALTREKASQFLEILTLMDENAALSAENAKLETKLEQATAVLKDVAPTEPNALRIWAKRALLTAPFLAVVTFGTATMGGIAASLCAATLVSNELTGAR